MEKSLSEIKWNNSTEEKITVKTQPRYQMHPNSAVVVDAVLVLVLLLLTRRIV